MISLPPLKRGDTFYIGCAARDTNGTTHDLTNIQVRSQVRSTATKKLIADLPIVKLDQTEFSLPLGYTTKAVYVNGFAKWQGATMIVGDSNILYYQVSLLSLIIK